MHVTITIRVCVCVCIYTLWSDVYTPYTHMGGNVLYELNDGVCVRFHTVYIKYMYIWGGVSVTGSYVFPSHPQTCWVAMVDLKLLPLAPEC